MPGYPRVAITHSNLNPHVPAERNLHFQVDRPGRWLVRAWMSGSRTPSADMPAGASNFEFVTDADGSMDKVLTHNAPRRGWFCQAAVIGAAQAPEEAQVPVRALFFGPSEVEIDGYNFGQWRLGSGFLANPVVGSSLAYTLDPPVARIVLAYPADLDKDPASVIQTSTGVNIAGLWGTNPLGTTVNGVAYRVYQAAPHMPWNNPDTYTATI